MKCIALSLLLLAALTPVPAGAGGYAVPDWSLEDIAGNPVGLHDQLDRGPVLISFWALWCAPCLKELPHLDELAAEMAGELAVLAINIDSPRSVHKVPSYVATKGYDHLTVLLDTAGDVQRKLQISGTMPFLMLLDAQGREVYRHVGYREGDELVLREEVAKLRETPAGEAAGGAFHATDQFEYSYHTGTESEIFENWLDADFNSGAFRFGVLLDTQQPAEEGDRRNDIRHRFVELLADDYEVRAGHFYGMFGRGLLFAAYENRTIRVDTALDGLLARGGHGPWQATVFSGTPSDLDLDVRGLDGTLRLHDRLSLGVTGLTWQAPDTPVRDGALLRDYALSGRLETAHRAGDLYVEYGGRRRWEQMPGGEFLERWGHAFYAGATVLAGPLGLSAEVMDYDEFTILAEADGRTPLNNPPSLTREHLYTLLNRQPYLRDADDERGLQGEITWAGPGGWSAVGNAALVELQDGRQSYREYYAHVEQSRIGAFRCRGGADWREVYDTHFLRDQEYVTAVGEITWYADARRSWTLKFEHQHARDPGTEFGGNGEYDQQFTTLEYATAPNWTFAAILETNNKYAAQRDFLEEEGPFPAAQISYVTDDGAMFTMWAGKRLGGYLCAGGVCKFEPAFEGVELFGTIRY
ncbi:TlpA family protein disulfide reductase [bacterium]|nr:TlpA family protein disulfide reductase [bacterium]